MKPFLRLILLILILAAFLFFSFWFTQPVGTLDRTTVREVSGIEFIEKATVDTFVRDGEILYDRTSLFPESAGIDDCPT